jgi:hypothetical protein
MFRNTVQYSTTSIKSIINSLCLEVRENMPRAENVPTEECGVPLFPQRLDFQALDPHFKRQPVNCQPGHDFTDKPLQKTSKAVQLSI